MDRTVMGEKKKKKKKKKKNKKKKKKKKKKKNIKKNGTDWRSRNCKKIHKKKSPWLLAEVSQEDATLCNKHASDAFFPILRTVTT